MTMTNNSTFVAAFDFYGKQFGLYTNSDTRFKTTFGSINGIFSILIIIAMAIYFVYEVFLNTNVTVTNYQDETISPSNNLTNIPIVFFLGDTYGRPIPQDGIYSFELTFYEYSSDMISNKQIVNVKLTDLEYRICEKEDLNGYEKYYSNLNISNFYCVPANKYNLTIYGKFADVSNGFSGINVYLIKCENSTSQSKCLDSKSTIKILTGSKLLISIIDNRINPFNYYSPDEVYLKSSVFQISPTLIKRYFYNIQENDYETDYGIIFQNKISKKFFKYESISFNVDEEMTSLTGKPVISHVNFINSDYVWVTSRRYNKLQTLLANVGGMMNAVLLISKYIVEIFTHKYAWQSVINRIFHLNKDDISFLNNSFSNEIKRLDVSVINPALEEKTKK
jgi:hypothetical protein